MKSNGLSGAMSSVKTTESTATVVVQDNVLKKNQKNQKKPMEWFTKITSTSAQKVQNDPTSQVQRSHGQYHSSKAHGNRRPSMSTNQQTPPTQDSTKSAEDALALEKARKEGRELERGLSTDSIPAVEGQDVLPNVPPHKTTVQQNQSTRPTVNGIPGPPLHAPPVSNPSSINTSLVPGQTVVPAAVPNHPGYVSECHNHRIDGSSQPQRKPVQQPNNASKRHLPEVGMPTASLNAPQKLDEQALQSKEMRIRSLEVELSKMQIAHDNTTSNAAVLQEENTKLKSEVSSWHMRFDRVNQELLHTRSELTNKVDDRWLVTQWGDLHAKIENLSHLYFVGRPTKVFGSILNRTKGSRAEKFDCQPSESLTRLTLQHAQYTGSKTRRPLIVQAFIWWMLTDNIFNHLDRSNGGLYWAGQTRALLYSLHNELRWGRLGNRSNANPKDSRRLETESQTFHKWRAMTSILLLQRDNLEKRTNSIGFIVTDTVSEIMESISPLIKDDQRPAADQNIRKQLHTILHAAISLDAEICQQRAWVFCEQRNVDCLSGFPFDSEVMEMTNGLDHVKETPTQFTEPCVELLIQPALFRMGNQYGEEYSTRTVLCKAKVVVCENYTTGRRS